MTAAVRAARSGALLPGRRLDVSRSGSDVVPLEDVGRGVSKGGDPVRLVVTPWS